jgi:hypothetical protein
MKFLKVTQINLEDGRGVTHTIEFDQDFKVLNQKVILDQTGEEIPKDDPEMESIFEFSSQFISPGDYYEDCRYRPILCYLNENGNLEGFDLVEGSNGWCCQEDKCGVKKLSMSEAYNLQKLWETEGQLGVLVSRGWEKDEAEDHIKTWGTK